MTVMELLTKDLTCACGAPVHLELSEDAAPAARRIWEGITVGVCDECLAEEERERQQAEEHARYERRLARSEMPAALVGLRWDQLARDGRAKALDGAQKWALGDIRGLLLYGAVGVGKTRIAATAANTLLSRRSLRWTSMPALFARLGAGANENSRRAALELLERTDALVLDDLDKVRATAYGAEQVFAIIDGRITAGAPLLATTNLSPNQLAEKFPEPFGEAIASRLIGYCQVHELGGEDRR